MSQSFNCIGCGNDIPTDGYILPIAELYTPIQKLGPFCLACLDDAIDEEVEECSQFGVGA